MENWYVGQPVVVIKSGAVFKKGEERVIQGISLAPCKCKNIQLHTGTNSAARYPIMVCEKCGCEWPNDDYFNGHLFAPMDVDISELTKQLEEPVELAQ